MPSNQENFLYEYGVIRFVPKVERGEFMNIGLIMMCKRQKWIKCKYEISRRKYSAFDTDIDFDELSTNLHFMVSIASGDPKYDQLGHLPVEERFRWLTAVKSSCIQTSEVHPGMTSDLDQTFDHLFNELVL